jgi:site-specific recombinase XerD
VGAAVRVQIKHINTIRKPNGKVYYYCRITGVRLPDDPESFEFRKAVETARARKAAPTPPAASDRSFGHLVKKYKETNRYTDLAERTRKEYDRHISYVGPILDNVSVAAIRRSHIRTIMGKFKETPTLAKAIKRTMSVLLSHAVEELNWIEANPAFGMERKRRRRKEDQHGDRDDRGQKPLEESQIAAVREANPEGSRRRALFEALLSTGFRRGDARRVPSSVSDDPVIALLTNKTGNLVVASITQNFREAAAAWNQTREDAGLKPSPYLICSEKGTPLHARKVSREITDAFAAAGPQGRDCTACDTRQPSDCWKADFPTMMSPSTWGTAWLPLPAPIAGSGAWRRSAQKPWTRSMRPAL